MNNLKTGVNTGQWHDEGQPVEVHTAPPTESRGVKMLGLVLMAIVIVLLIIAPLAIAAAL